MGNVLDSLDGGVSVLDSLEGGVHSTEEKEPSFLRDVLYKTATDIPKKAISGLELGANLATSFFPMGAEGIAKAADFATGNKYGIEETVGKAVEPFVYKPQTEYGKQDMNAMAGLFDWWHKKSVGVGEFVQEKAEPIVGPAAAANWGSSTATVMEALPLAAGEVVKYGKGKARAREFAKDSAEIKSKLAEEKRIKYEDDLRKADEAKVTEANRGIADEPPVSSVLEELELGKEVEDFNPKSDWETRPGIEHDQFDSPYAYEGRPPDIPNAGTELPAPVEDIRVLKSGATSSRVDAMVDSTSKMQMSKNAAVTDMLRIAKDAEVSGNTYEAGMFKKTAEEIKRGRFNVRPKRLPGEGILSNNRGSSQLITDFSKLGRDAIDKLAKGLDALPLVKYVGDFGGHPMFQQEAPGVGSFMVAPGETLAGAFKRARERYSGTPVKVELKPEIKVDLSERMRPLRLEREWDRLAYIRENLKDYFVDIDAGRIPEHGDHPVAAELKSKGKSTKEIREYLSDTEKKQSEIKKQLDEMRRKGGPLGNEHGSSQLIKDIGEATYKAGRRALEFFSPFSTMPEGTAYKALRYKALGDGARVDRITKILHDRLRVLPDDMKKDVFNVIRGEIPITSIPQDLHVIVKQTIADIDRVGSLLVKHGILDKATYEAKKGQYIHYMYLKHLLPDGTTIPTGAGGRMDLGYIKRRVLDDLKLPKNEIEQIRKELGLIEDASIAAPVGVGKALHDLAKDAKFKTIAAHPDWTWQPGQVAIEMKLNAKTGAYEPVKMGIGKLTQEVETYRQMIERGASTPEVQARYKLLKDALENASNVLDKAPEDYLQLPTSPNYGDLAGSFVRKEIAQDIMPVLSMSANELEGLAVAWNKVGRTLDTGMTLYKAFKVALNPPTVVRNVVSNPLQMNLSGIGAHRIGFLVKDSILGIIKKDKLYRLFERHGGFKTNMSQTELAEVFKRFERVKGDKIDQVLAAVADVSKYYGKIDDVFKMAIFRDAILDRKMSPSDAAMEAHKWGMDYSLTSRSVKHARRTVLPMSTYYYKIAPLLAEAAVKRPWVYAKYAAIPYVTAKLAAYRYDMSDADLDKALRLMAEKTKKMGSFVLLPFKDNKGNLEIVNLEYYTPWGNWLQAAREIKGGNYVDALNQFGGVFGPYGKFLSMLATKKVGEPPVDPYTGQPVYSKLDSKPIQYAKQVEWYWQLFGPSAFSSTGAAGYTYKAAMGQKDKWGTEATGWKAFGRWMGANVGSLNRKQVINTREYEIKKLELEKMKILKDPMYSKERKQEAIRRFIQERRKITHPE